MNSDINVGLDADHKRESKVIVDARAASIGLAANECADHSTLTAVVVYNYNKRGLPFDEHPQVICNLHVYSVG
jgi:hypothetical protein